MIRKPIRWGAPIAWLVAGMVIAFIALGNLPTRLSNQADAQKGGATVLETPAAQAAASCDARSLSQSFVQVASRLKPAVVTISIEKKGGGVEGAPEGFEEFFRRFHGGPGPAPGPAPGRKPRPMIQRGVGSGFVIDKAGHVLTNNHVVEGADRVTVITSEGRRLKGKVVGADKKDDLAVVKIEENANLPIVAFGDSDRLQVGELVMAIGSPLGLQQSVTTGVVSAKGRRLDGTPYAFEDFVQTDAAINHGNSGGPLVNMNGEVIGVNSRIAGEGTGIGFSVSSNVARRVAQALIKDGRVRRPYIGVSLQELTPEMAPHFKAQNGVIVGAVLVGSPAAKAGVQVGDVVTSVDGKAVTTSEQVVRAVQAHQVGQEVRLAIVRSGAQKQLSLSAAEAPDEHVKTSLASGGGGSQGKYGLRLADLTPEDAQKLGLSARKGAVITEVEPGSTADEAGLSEGDVVVEVDRKPVARAEEVVAVLGRGGSHLLRIEARGGTSRYVPLSPSK